MYSLNLLFIEIICFPGCHAKAQRCEDSRREFFEARNIKNRQFNSSVRPRARKKSLPSLHFNSRPIYLYLDYFHFESAQSVVQSLLLYTEYCTKFNGRDIFHAKVPKSRAGIKTGCNFGQSNFQCNAEICMPHRLSRINHFRIRNVEIATRLGRYRRFRKRTRIGPEETIEIVSGNWPLGPPTIVNFTSVRQRDIYLRNFPSVARARAIGRAKIPVIDAFSFRN